jgi:3-oxoacid CoA-transferase subunit A
MCAEYGILTAKEQTKMIYIIGDTHRDFARVENFCARFDTAAEDVLIILGDAGINYFGGGKDKSLKQKLLTLPITLFCIHWNHEMRPATVATDEEPEWHGGAVYIEREFPKLLFAKDGEIFKLEGKRCVVIGGAYSVDKHYRQIKGWNWFGDEQPSEEIKAYVERRLAAENWDADIVSHIQAHCDTSRARPLFRVLTSAKSTRVRSVGSTK